MELLQTFAVLILVLFVVHFVMVNVLKIPFKDLVPVHGATEGLHNLSNGTVTLTQSQLDAIQQDNEVTSLSGIEQQLRKDFGVADLDHQKQKQQGGMITNVLSDKLAEQAIYDPNRERTYTIAPSNQDIYEKEADFGNEQTNISQFFATNPGVFFNDQRHNAYVPDVTQWGQHGTQLYAEMVNAPRAQLQAFGYDKNVAPAKLI